LSVSTTLSMSHTYHINGIDVLKDSSCIDLGVVISQYLSFISILMVLCLKLDLESVLFSEDLFLEITVLCSVHSEHTYGQSSNKTLLFGVPVFCILLSYLKSFKEVFPSVYLPCHPLLMLNDLLSLILKRWN
jgi:hypothetical protein